MDWILVAAIIPHNPESWGYTQTADGTVLLVTDDKQFGAHTTPILLPLFAYVIIKVSNPIIEHKLLGNDPIQYDLSYYLFH